MIWMRFFRLNMVLLKIDYINPFLISVKSGKANDFQMRERKNPAFSCSLYDHWDSKNNNNSKFRQHKLQYWTTVLVKCQQDQAPE